MVSRQRESVKARQRVEKGNRKAFLLSEMVSDHTALDYTNHVCIYDKCRASLRPLRKHSKPNTCTVALL